MATVDTNKRPVTDLIASRDQLAGLSDLGDILPNPDKVLKSQGTDIQVYRDLLAEPLVMGATARIEGAIAQRAWRLKQQDTDQRVYDGINQWLQQLDIDSIVQRMINGYYFGYQPLEVLWQASNSGWWPTDITDKPAEWFGFDKQNQLRFFSKQNEQEGVAVPERRFLIARHKHSYHNPYGMPVMSACFWPVTFKRGGLKFWLKFAEKYGMPYMLGKLPRTASKTEYDNLADNLHAAIQDAVVVTPDDGSVEIIEAAGKGASASLYKDLMMYCRSEINIAMLGQNQSTEAEANRASATAGIEVTESIVERISSMCEAAFNEVISWVVYYNYGAVAAPKLELLDQAKIDDEQSQRDKRLHSIGVRFTSQYFADQYSISPQHIDSVQQSKAAQDAGAVALAEGDAEDTGHQDALDEALRSLDASNNQQTESIAKAAMQAVVAGSDDDDILGLLAEAYPNLDDTALHDKLTQMLFVASLVGAGEVQEELQADLQKEQKGSV